MSHLISIELDSDIAKDLLVQANNSIEVSHASDENADESVVALAQAIQNAIDEDDAQDD